MKRFVLLAVLLVAVCFSSFAQAQQAPANFPGLGPKGTLAAVEFEKTGDVVLRGPNARQQLLVTGRYSSGQLHDLTHDVTYQVVKAGIVNVAPDGFVAPVADGEVAVTATVDGKSATTTLRVEGIGSPRPVNFSNEIVPIFTKLGCNAGGCHGKSDGQNGFKLSLLGFYPNEDYEYLVKEDRGRRIFPASPEFSLLLSKPANKLPHGGGHRLDPGSYEWQLLTGWIEQGMPYGSEDDPTIDRIEVFPKTRAMNRDSQQQLSVVAHYSDGSKRDVTRIATYESNDSEMADAAPSGRIEMFDVPGDVAVMIRFQGQVTVFRASVPLGMQVTNLPPTRNVIDEHVFAKLKLLGIPPSVLADDSMFIRRVFLDITGRLPTADEARAFLADKDPNKRDKLVDYLVDSPGYGDYFANKWSMVLRNQRVQTSAASSFKFHGWIRQALQRNMPYDEFVRNVLAATGDVDSHPPVSWFTQVNTSLEQMEDTAQLFLGMRIQCARCHHHPFERWSQNDYYGFHAFFSRVGRKPGRKGTANARIFHNTGRAISRNPRTQKDLVPAGLGGEPLEIPDYDDPRHYLVDWMAKPDNPYFAPALVNRYWKHFFGRGIVDPEDDMRVTNPPANPELLAAVSKHFIEKGFDLKDLVRTICKSSTYQLSSEPNEYNLTDKQNFSGFFPRRMNAEPLYDALNQVTGVPARFTGLPAGTRAVQLPDTGFNDYFLTVFGKPQAASACECERISEANLAQSLHLLNSAEVQGKLSAGNGRASMLAANEDLTDAQRVEELYLWTFARKPRQDELALVLPFIERKANKKQAFEDLLWVLINTKEFLFIR